MDLLVYQSTEMTVTVQTDSNTESTPVCNWESVDKTKAIIVLTLGGLLGLGITIWNLMILHCLRIEPKLRNSSVLLYGSLSLADLIVGIISVPTYLFIDVFDCWPLGDFTCDLLTTSDFVSSTVGCFSLIAIMVDRYFAIKMPMKYVSVKTGTKLSIVISIIWILAVAIWAPIIFGIRAATDHSLFAGGCYFLYYTQEFVGFIGNGISYFAPMVCMVVVGIMLILQIKKTIAASTILRTSSINVNEKDFKYLSKKVRMQMSETSFKSSSNEQSSDTSESVIEPQPSTSTGLTPAISLTSLALMERLSKETRKLYLNEVRATRILVFVFVAFTICSLPWLVIWALDTVHPGIVPMYVYNIAVWMFYANSLVNPCLYVATNKLFRQTIRKLFSKCPKVNCPKRPRIPIQNTNVYVVNK